ncbi:ParB N-terminal domain-containing protein [Blastomonas fulva]|uniref:ParB/RepB/Spo0J family partition protein n=1 Tax=Blastomonas fulva TaxID=1550728 RepID=UPI003F72684C
MAKAKPVITLSPSRDIPFDRLVLSQSNVRQTKCGVSIAELAEDIARRSLLQGLNVRPVFGEQGEETGMFEIPAGGRRYRALELLVKQKRLAHNAPVPCIVQQAGHAILAEEDSLAENSAREPLHPLDQFRAMQALVARGQEVEAIAAHFMTTPAVVRQRLKLASVSPRLHAIYADDGMTLDQLMAFTVSDDHARQEQVWELLGTSFNRSAAQIRYRLTENTVRAHDKRVRYVTDAAYMAAGGSIARDLFEADDGGWLTDVALLDRLVAEKLVRDADTIAREGWKWVSIAVDLPWNATHGMRRIEGIRAEPTPEQATRLADLEEQSGALCRQWADESEVPDEVHALIEAIGIEIGTIVEQPVSFDPEDMARAGAFVSINGDGALRIERGFVKPEDEPAVSLSGVDAGQDAADPDSAPDAGTDLPAGSEEAARGADADDGARADEEPDGLKPLPDRLISDLTAWRTLALQDALARNGDVAYAAVLHAMVLAAFYSHSHRSCMQLALHPVQFGNPPEGLRDCAPACLITERHADWKARLPGSDADLWDALLRLGSEDRASLFAHCASLAINAQAEIVPRYDNGRISKHGIESRIAHAHVIAHATGLDMVAAGWRPTVQGYLRSITKQQILADVAEARGEQFAAMIGHLRKSDMAREAERLLEETGWLPDVLRTVGEPHIKPGAEAGDDANGALPEGLAGLVGTSDDEDGEAMPIAAE